MQKKTLKKSLYFFSSEKMMFEKDDLGLSLGFNLPKKQVNLKSNPSVSLTPSSSSFGLLRRSSLNESFNSSGTLYSFQNIFLSFIFSREKKQRSHLFDLCMQFHTQIQVVLKQEPSSVESTWTNHRLRRNTATKTPEYLLLTAQSRAPPGRGAREKRTQIRKAREESATMKTVITRGRSLDSPKINLLFSKRPSRITALLTPSRSKLWLSS